MFEHYKDFADYSMKFAQKMGADWAEARLESISGTGFGMDNGVPVTSAFDDVNGLGIRFNINGSQGFVSTTKFDKKKISELVTKAIDSVRYSSSTVHEAIGISDEEMHKKKYSVSPKINPLDVSTTDKIKLLTDLHKHLTSLKVPASSTSLSVGDSLTQKYYVNSDGARIQSTLPYVSFFYFFTMSKGQHSAQRFNSLGATNGWEAIKNWNLTKNLGDEANALAKNISKATKTPTGNVNVVVSPEVTGIMVHESVGHPYEGDRILGRESAQAGESFVKPSMLGSKVAPEILSIIDDPRLPNSAGYYLYDDEGVKARKRFLVKYGKMNELYHNRETAFAMKTKSNASSRASAFDKEPIVRMANTYVEPRNHSFEELLEEAKNGIYIKNFMEWNISDDRTNFREIGNEAYMIRNGKLAEPVWRPTIEITQDKFWNAVTAIANKKTLEYTTGNCGKGEPMQGIPVFFGGPAMLLKGVRV